MIKVKTALISVSDKKGLVPFVKGLHQLGVTILSTGGTARQISQAGIPVTEVSDYTGFPEMLDGRVKTLHPKIHGGLLALRQNQDHLDQIKKHNIGLIDLVVVNLYPFESVTKKKNVSLEEAIENIDIGGPSMLRSAAKNYKSVAVIANPDRYPGILAELNSNSGILPDTILFKLAIEAFQHTAKYDSIISTYLNNKLTSEDFSPMPKSIMQRYEKIQDLRYGENPHQSAALYQKTGEQTGLAALKQLHGKELSFNNILDLNAAVEFVSPFKEPAAVIIKHNNPTGIAVDADLSKAYIQAWKTDQLSAFGGIVGLNRKVDEQTAEKISNSGFMECIIAPSFSKEALTILKKKKNIRLIQIDLKKWVQELELKPLNGALLVQEKDTRILSKSDLKIVTVKKPTAAQLASMMFGWQVIKHVKSNAIILVKGQRVVGIGCGQTSRVGSVDIAIHKAGKEAVNAVLISDAFFPKTDNVEIAAKAGIKAIIQTGGSIADDEVIRAADKAGIAMVFTGIRHFKH